MRPVALSASGDGRHRPEREKGGGKLGRIDADISVGNTKHTYDGKVLRARIVGRMVLEVWTGLSRLRLRERNQHKPALLFRGIKLVYVLLQALKWVSNSSREHIKKGL